MGLMNSIPKLLSQAFQYHQAGELQKAEECYRRLLQQNPRNVDAWHMLGLVVLQTSRLDLAGECIGKAVN